MSTEQKSLGQIAWEIETEGYGWTWTEVHDQDRAHWERIAQAVADAVIERQKYTQQPTDVTQSTAEYWVKIRGGVIDALATRGLQIVSNTSGVTLAPINSAQPTADERVAEHMRLVAAYGAQVQRDAFSGASLTLKLDAQEPDYSRIVAVEQSARALLSASQEDAEHAAMYRWLREHGADNRVNWLHDEFHGVTELMQGEMLDDAIRAAMSAKETK